MQYGEREASFRQCVNKERKPSQEHAKQELEEASEKISQGMQQGNEQAVKEGQISQDAAISEFHEAQRQPFSYTKQWGTIDRIEGIPVTN